ncbi:DMT family transporter [Moorena producens]|uniref:DMT family transporter n=1 Tax=Moorena producens TaxID=1155739 RepID=UPI003C7654D4
MHQLINPKIFPLARKASFMPLLALLMATFILSFAAILTKLAEFDLGPGATIFNRYWIAAVTFSLWESQKLVFPGKPEQECKSSGHLTIKDLILFGIEPLMTFICVSLWAISLTQTSVANANLLHNMTPIFSTLGAWLLLKQQFDNRFLVGLGIALFASSCIEFEDWFIAPSNFTGDMLALLSSVFYAGAFLARESLCNKYSVSTILLWSCFLRAILALGFTLIMEDHLFPLTQSAWFSVVALGIVVQVFGHGLLTYSFKHFSSSFVSVCLLLDPLITALFAWIIFAEKLTPLNMVSFLGVIAGIYLARLGKGSQKAG